MLFSGFVSEEVLSALGNVLKKKIVQKGEAPNKVKQVFSVFIELVQNVIRYSAEHVYIGENGPDKLSSGVINVGYRDGRFYVGCGNTITVENAAKLREQLDIIRRLDKKELRTIYCEKLREKTDPGLETGTNLGLLEVARRSTAPIKYDFFEIDADKSFYYIMSYI